MNVDRRMIVAAPTTTPSVAAGINSTAAPVIAPMFRASFKPLVSLPGGKSVDARKKSRLANAGAPSSPSIVEASSSGIHLKSSGFESEAH
ncbi:hypothetical protein GUJ93_ZPchr0002g23024 [Zizania palustris]|uniref:Uncharacterized protein n=1 Tax=Zizania palustris TaxID=103762 RepID=A0A8J5V282_ZIZPA|nr:hypothetical protein GUJ93_ZPchr0008g11769 [Zizania palustris]KAG8059879.1 hypothetical protein GUJ93_ZPchr0002g23024 [Zizania palustris]